MVIPATVVHPWDHETYTVTEIFTGAFTKCPDLTSVVLPETITSIGPGAFWQCTSLKEIKIPDSVTQVGKFAFGGCTSLAKVQYSSGCTSLQQGAMLECGRDDWELVVGGLENVTEIGPLAFHYTKLWEYPYWENIKKIGEGAFDQSYLQSVVLYPGCEYAPFKHCYGLKTVEIYDEKENLNEYFIDCPNISLIRLHFTKPPALSQDWVVELRNYDCVLEVPEEAIESFREATYWKNFF
ncbi:MAG: leucine-rich repeat domain-containing protein [Muribaculaceae bacterium]|nr:leucine-rich repeat domain-containing protein [Muribaculaceae bacterium]